MITDILVPVDGSEFSEHALPVALDIARRTGAVLHIVHVHEPTVMPAMADGVPTFDATLDEQIRGREEEYLAGLASRCMERAGISPKTELLAGVIATAASSYAAETGVDLIVMTTHGRGGISRAWLGSVADALVRRAAVPIMLVRPRQEAVDWSRLTRPQHVLVPLDGSELSERILEPAIDIGRLTGARFTLLHVVLPVPFTPVGAGPVMFAPNGILTSQAEAAAHLESVARSLRTRRFDVTTDTVIHAVPALAILDYAATHAADMIAMATHGRGGWSRLALGSVTDKVMRGALMPILLYRPGGHPTPDSAHDEASDIMHAAEDTWPSR